MPALNLDPLARLPWRGRTNVDQITAAAIEYAETLRRVPGSLFTITQGSYQSGAGDPLSAGTHDMGGVVDCRWTGDNHDVWALRAAGFAAWHRTPAQGPWPDHIHAVLVGHPLLADSAARQVEAYRDGRNGLANNGPDDSPRINPIPVFEWPREDWFDMASQDELRAVVREELDKLLDAEQANGKSLRENIRIGANARDVAKEILEGVTALVGQADKGKRG